MTGEQVAPRGFAEYFHARGASVAIFLRELEMKLHFPLLALTIGVVGSLGAQTTPFLTDRQIQLLSSEISGDRSYEHIRWLTHWHRDSGMEGYFKAADYIIAAAKDVGLTDVKFVEQTMDDPNYTARSAELWMVEPVRVKLADIGDRAVYLSDGSHDADVTAEMVWIGDGSETALKNLDVVGKIVLTSGNPGTAVRNAVWDKGAVGVVTFTTSENKNPMDWPDQIAWTRIPIEPPAGKKGAFAFALPPRKGDMLRRLLETKQMQDIFATGTRTMGGRVVLKARVDTDIGRTPGRTGFVEGWIRGSKYPNQQIVLTAHLQEEQGSANDDGSGSGNLLEIARTINTLVADGSLPRPLRDLRFWWTDEISSEYRLFQDHPDEVGKILANVHQDMVGANQAMGSRVQHLIFAPHSRTSYLDAIYESIGTYLVKTNNGFLAASRSGGYPRPYTRPIYSTRGSRQGYNARFVPWFGSSDHGVFVDGPIGIPAVAAINWDDEWIHSSEDDLGNVDQTQLARNAFLTAATALVLAYAEPAQVPLFVSEVHAQGARRLANDLEVAMQSLGDATRSAAQRWSDASMMIEQGIQRELRAVGSVRVFADGNAAAASPIESFSVRVRARQPELMADLRAYAATRSVPSPATVTPTPEERAAMAKVPSNAGTINDYFTKRGQMRVTTGLHGLMRNEAFNFVDGKRSYFDIYKAARAESLAGGNWYYGTVTLADVSKLLDAAVTAGALRLR